MSVNYIIAAYFGPRRCGGNRYKKDPTAFIKAQEEALGRLKHSLAHITIVVNGASPAYKFPSSISGVPVDVHSRENSKGSYGAWDAAFSIYCGRYDYHIAVEDDYIPCHDNFDTIMVEVMEKNKYDLLFQLYTSVPSISNGIFRSSCVDRIIREEKTILQSDNPNYAHYHNLEHHQVSFHRKFLNRGMKIGSMTDHEIGSRFWRFPGGEVRYGDPDKMELLIPCQLL